ncbi:branched-chain amino acid transport system II carrier protein [Capnocytophaga canis]|uniref:branched-chain amino acid transport system II carrier protein n=1 Tax=Capnocytophaga TaxID=1016 RepID=UPI000BB19790|nr:branched-chain amino acid transport system II carrier protein [Capnocytophaga sp. H4358]ATA72952.1 branched-chain amino acid transport system II carrier protein [Capnocytophaga sp. H4358]
MKTHKNKTLTITTVGFALFAMFFGAGNLILPPFIGLQSGDEWLMALVGFFLTAILAPFLGVLVISKSGLSFTDLGYRTHPKLINVLAILIILCIGPLVAIPRTGATVFEIGVQPSFPSFSNVVFAILFFGTVFLLSISKTKTVDIIGKFLTPFLLLSLVVLVVLGVINPPDVITESTMTATEVFSFGFVEGYQTLDVLASVIFAGVIIEAVIDKGFSSENERSRITLAAGLVSTISLLLIYGGLIYLGATTDFPMQDNSTRTQLLLHISSSILGEKGTFVVAIAIAFACLTTAIALTTATGSIFEKISHGKIPYRLSVILCTLISVVLSINGVDAIIKYAVNILLFIYPIVFALILYLLLFGRYVKIRQPYVASIITTAIVSLISVGINLDMQKELLSTLKSYLPLQEYSLEWLLPSLIAFVFGTALDRNQN